MGTNTLPAAVDDNIIPAEHHNSLVEAMLLDLVPRNASRVPSSDAGQLGSSVFRWLRAYLGEVLVGVTANNLKLKEGATGELWLENPNGDSVRLKDGGISFYTNSVHRFEVSDTGINWGLITDATIPTLKTELKAITTQAPINFNSLSVVDIFSFAKVLKLGKNYIINLDWGAQSGISTNTRLEINVAAVNLRVFDGNSAVTGIGSVAFMFTAAASVSTNFFIRGKGIFTNISCQVVEL